MVDAVRCESLQYLRGPVSDPQLATAKIGGNNFFLRFDYGTGVVNHKRHAIIGKCDSCAQMIITSLDFSLLPVIARFSLRSAEDDRERKFYAQNDSQRIVSARIQVATGQRSTIQI